MSQSKFVWHDLMTKDVEAASRFYGELFGWKVKKDKDSPYHLILLGEKDIGGMMALDPKAPIPPHWIGYVSTDSVERALGDVEKLGGRVHHKAMPIPHVGTFAVAGDPQGGVFCPFKYEGQAPKAESDAPPAPSTFCWDELMTSDPAAATKFYTGVFGWTTQSMEMPNFGTYTLFLRDGGKNVGGMMKLPPGVPQTFWLTYVAVEKTDATVEKAQRLGGKVAVPAMDIPNVGRFATFLDPQGAAFAVLGK